MEETTINNPQLPPNPTKFYTHFLYKAIFLSIFLLLVPLFPSQAIINHKTINTTSWELLQLIFVGIAVSYGLFSKRNEETPPKEDSPFKPDNAQSYVARLLQVSSVFDDDSDPLSAPGPNDTVQTWNSQYYRGEPIVVVAKEINDASTIEKPLLLPVRSLKPGLSEPSTPSTIDSKTNSFNGSNSRGILKNLSRLNREDSDENVVLRSPIPWRSRSGKMELKEDFSQTPGVHDTPKTNSPSFKYPFSKPTSSPTISSQIPHPPPPPPPPQPRHVNYNHSTRPKMFSDKELKRSPEFRTRSRSDVGKSVRTRKDSELELEENLLLSHDREIERFIERKGSERKKLLMDEEEDAETEKKKKKKKEAENEEIIMGGPDVDKKADEFIAKFREQIRLQRIASIRKSTGQSHSHR